MPPLAKRRPAAVRVCLCAQGTAGQKKRFSFATCVLVAKLLLHVAVGGLATVVVSRGQQAGRVWGTLWWTQHQTKKARAMPTADRERNVTRARGEACCASSTTWRTLQNTKIRPVTTIAVIAQW